MIQNKAVNFLTSWTEQSRHYRYLGENRVATSNVKYRKELSVLLPGTEQSCHYFSQGQNRAFTTSSWDRTELSLLLPGTGGVNLFLLEELQR
jgi:hypothetical protein